MNPEKTDSGHELPQKQDFTPPAVELLLEPEQGVSAWPERITRNAEFVKQREDRRKLNARLDAILSRLPRPDISLQEAVSEKYITEVEVADLYASLSQLVDDADYRRLVLYLPFEFLPNTAWKPATEALQHSAKQFRDAYMTAWHSLLREHNVRANFVDGDVLEVESRESDLPRVVKAAHLIPKLVEKGFLEVGDILALMETSEDETLRQSIADALPVLADIGLISDAELAQMGASDDVLVRDTAALARSSPAEVGGNREPRPVTFIFLQNELRDEFARIDGEKYGKGVRKNRVAWLRQEKKRQAVETAGNDISAVVRAGTLTSEMVAEFKGEDVDPVLQQAFIDGIRKAIESGAKDDIQSAKTLYAHYQEAFVSLWERGESDTREVLSKIFCRLHGLGIVGDEQLAALDITIPALAGPFSENLKSMDKEMGDIRGMVTAMTSDAELSSYVYPVVLVHGSRLKGYGTDSADIDISVIVRPETSFDDRAKVQAKLKKIFVHEKIPDFKEFWLEETDDGLQVLDSDKYDLSLGGRSWTHVLFGAAWEGDEHAIRELREKLLVPYFYDTDQRIHGLEARQAYLEELERDTLQYRLMHKGYERFFPSRGGIHTPHSDRIDGQSTFWDSGYRQVATKLFASRVFLPKISQEK